MEHSSKAEKSSDNTDKAEKKSSKWVHSRVTHVPLPLEARLQDEILQQSVEQPDEHSEGKEKKKKKRKKRTSALTPPAEHTLEEAVEPVKKKKETAASETDAEQDQPASTKEAAEVTVPPKAEYQGELLISERARRQRENSAEQRTEKSEATLEENPVDTHSDTTDTALAPETDVSEQVTTEPSKTPEVPNPPVVATPRTAPIPPKLNQSAPPIVPPPPFGAFGRDVPFDPARYETAVASAQRTEVTPPVTKPEVRSDRRAERRNLLAGLIAGGLIEHVRHRKREKRMTAEYKETTIKLERTKTELEQRLERLQKKVAARSEAVPAPSVKETALVQVAEQLPATSTAELNSRKEEDSVAEARKKLEQVIAQREAEDDPEQAKLPDNRRLETSAWHRIEVDKKTGKAVENPTLAYGKEYQNEQHQEKLRREIEAATMVNEAVQQKHRDAEQTSSAEANGGGASASSKDKKQGKGKGNSLSAAVSSVGVIDIVLWGILLLVIGAIITALTA